MERVMFRVRLNDISDMGVGNGNGRVLLRVKLRPHRWRDVEPWTRSIVWANAWRVVPYMDADDLYQEAYLIFVRCKERYARVLKQEHFFALYSRALTNYVTDLARRRSRCPYITGCDEELPLCPDHVGDPDLQVQLTEECPKRIRNVILALQQDRKRRRFRYETEDRYWSRLGGFRREVEGFAKTVKGWFSGEVPGNNVV